MLKTFFIVILFVSSVFPAYRPFAGFVNMKHYINDTLTAHDTLYPPGSQYWPTFGQVTLSATTDIKGYMATNLILACDFTPGMTSTAQDTSAPKVNLVRDAVRRFLDRTILEDDGLAFMRFAENCQFFPEKERPLRWNPVANAFVDSGNLGGLNPSDTVYSDTIYFVPCSLSGFADTSLYLGMDYGSPMYGLNMTNSFGLERLYWEFSHQVRVRCCCSWAPPAEGPDTCAVDYIFEGDWGWWAPSVDPRLGGYTRSVYYSLWQAIRYALRYNDKAEQPRIIFITSGVDETSARMFRNLHDKSYWPIPSMFSPDSIPSDTSFTAMQVQFLKFMDSINAHTGGVQLHVVVMDTSRKPDYATLYTAAVVKTGGTFMKSGGKDLVSYMDTLFTRTHESCACAAMRHLPGEPVLVDHLGPGLHYIQGSIHEGTRNTIPFDSVTIDSSLSGTFFRYFLDMHPIYGDDIFEYHYRFQTDSCANGPGVTENVVNPDSSFSKFHMTNPYKDTVSFFFPADTFWIKCPPISTEQRSAQVAPAKFTLEQNLPNPFTSSTSIRYGIPSKTPADVRILVYDIRGKVVYGSRAERGPGYHEFVWNGASLASGVYHLDFTAGKFRKQMKLLMIK